ncbi:ADP-ribosylation factor-like [Patiria miniata]|uniref:ADP-ribosylation factor n=1 Tax=Patiria miniata TaxID=46514 RepID=A0A914BFG8_PATMI|nr:ADP-ribosylation factor-like [Patiria miniata]
MGSFFSRRIRDIQNYFSSRVHHRILMLGLDAAGKTTVLYRLKENITVNVIPTIGFNVETVHPAPGLALDMWDVGGGDKIRPLKRHYKRSGVLLVVDSTDHERFDEAREELVMILNDSHVGLPVVILANKQDLPNAVSPSQLCDALRLTDLPKGYPWQIVGTSAINGDGLQEAAISLGKMVKKYKKDNRHLRKDSIP